MKERMTSPNCGSCEADDKRIAVGLQESFGPVILTENINKDVNLPRTIEEIRADIDLCIACLESQNVCNRHCHECGYLPYEENFPALAQENYIAYRDRKKRETAIEGIATDRLVEICNAERENRCFVRTK